MSGDAKRDEFLRGVIHELFVSNVRWPGLWTSLSSLMSERDSLRDGWMDDLMMRGYAEWEAQEVVDGAFRPVNGSEASFKYPKSGLGGG